MPLSVNVKSFWWFSHTVTTHNPTPREDDYCTSEMLQEQVTINGQTSLILINSMSGPLKSSLMKHSRPASSFSQCLLRYHTPWHLGNARIGILRGAQNTVALLTRHAFRIVPTLGGFSDPAVRWITMHYPTFTANPKIEREQMSQSLLLLTAPSQHSQ